MRLLLIPVVALALVLLGCSDRSADSTTATSASDGATTESPAAPTGDSAPPTNDSAAATTPADADAQDDTSLFPRTVSGDRKAPATVSVRDLSNNAAPVVTRKVDLFENYVTVEMPDRLMPMNKDQLAVKYAGESEPDIAYTDQSTRVNFTATFTDVFVSPGQLYEYRGLMQAELERMYPNMDLLSSKAYTVDGGPCFLIEFYNPLEDALVYNMILGASYENKLMVMTFNFPSQLEEVWKPVGRSLLLTADFHRSGRDGQPTDEDMADMDAGSAEADSAADTETGADESADE